MNEKIVEAQEKIASRKKLRERSDLKKVLETSEGRRVLWRILSFVGVLRSSFNSDPLLMAMTEGRREVGLFLISEIMEGGLGEKLHQMQREAGSMIKQDNNEIMEVVNEYERD